MTILDLYQSMSTNEEVNKIYYSTGDTQVNGLGKVFSFFNTNYRSLLKRQSNTYLGFGRGFIAISAVEGIRYSEWEKYEANNENVLKQHTVRMRKSELFSVTNGVYKKTKRGEVFGRMLEADGEKLSDSEKRLLCYLLILTGYFSNIKNYIINKTQDAFRAYGISGFSEDEILALQKDFILKSRSWQNNKDMLQHDYAYLESFCFQYKEIDFNKLFKTASDAEKDCLKKYVIAQIESDKCSCILSHKFVNGGNYTKSTMEDSCMILYVTKKLSQSNIRSFDEFIDKVIEIYSTIYICDCERVKNFVYDEENIGVFRVVYERVFSIEQDKKVYESDVRSISVDDHKKFDTTDEKGVEENDKFSSALKAVVKINSGYKCFMHDIERCKYFKSKESNENYLEIHHFIPREFANDFEESIENKDNYVPLCPNCHRKIHFAVDSERKHLITQIYTMRKEALKADRLIPESEKIDGKDFLDILFEYYRVEE